MSHHRSLSLTWSFSSTNPLGKEHRQPRSREPPRYLSWGQEGGQQRYQILLSLEKSIIPKIIPKLTAWTEIAKDSNVGIGDRATAAKDALGNKVDETKHDVSAIFLTHLPKLPQLSFWLLAPKHLDKVRGIQAVQVNVYISRLCDHRHDLVMHGTGVMDRRLGFSL